MTASEIVEHVRARGGQLRVIGRRLQYRPADALSGLEREWLRWHRDEVIRELADPHRAERCSRLDPAVGWRVEAMRPQVPTTGAMPLLLARPGAQFAPGTCGSCGSRLGAAERYRCRLCTDAAVAVLGVRR